MTLESNSYNQSKIVVARDWGKVGSGQLLFNGYRASSMRVENTLAICHTTMCIQLILLYYTLENS